MEKRNNAWKLCKDEMSETTNEKKQHELTEKRRIESSNGSHVMWCARAGNSYKLCETKDR